MIPVQILRSLLVVPGPLLLRKLLTSSQLLPCITLVVLLTRSKIHLWIYLTTHSPELSKTLTQALTTSWVTWIKCCKALATVLLKLPTCQITVLMLSLPWTMVEYYLTTGWSAMTMVLSVNIPAKILSQCKAWPMALFVILTTLIKRLRLLLPRALLRFKIT